LARTRHHIRFFGSELVASWENATVSPTITGAENDSESSIWIVYVAAAATSPQSKTICCPGEVVGGAGRAPVARRHDRRVGAKEAQRQRDALAGVLLERERDLVAREIDGLAGALRVESHALVRLASVLHEREREAPIGGQSPVGINRRRGRRSRARPGASAPCRAARDDDCNRDRHRETDHRRPPPGIM
jgi:hypothetical protein